VGSKHLGGDINFAWPSAKTPLWEPKEQQYNIQRQFPHRPILDETRQKLKNDTEKFYNPLYCVWIIDDVVDPSETRPKIIRSLEMLQKIQYKPPQSTATYR
jgi:acetyl-CoA carboxylase carboxyltransferase component